MSLEVRGREWALQNRPAKGNIHLPTVFISPVFDCSLISLPRIHPPSGPWAEWDTHELYDPNTTSSLQGGDTDHQRTCSGDLLSHCTYNRSSGGERVQRAQWHRSVLVIIICVWLSLGVLLGAAESRECVGMRGQRSGHRFALQVLQTCGECIVA